MAKIVFEIKNEHIQLLKHLKWSLTADNKIISIETNENDVVEEHSFISDLYEEFGNILYGKPTIPIESLIKAEELYSFSQEQKDEMLQLLKELPTALEIVLSRQSFEIGKFRMKLHEGIWNKID